MCSFTYQSRESQIVHYCIAVGLLLVLPLSIGIFGYYKIFLKINQQQHNVVPSPQNRTENGSVTNSVKEININRVLLYQCGHLHSSFDFPLKPAQELQLC